MTSVDIALKGISGAFIYGSILGLIWFVMGDPRPVVIAAMIACVTGYLVGWWQRGYNGKIK